MARCFVDCTNPPISPSSSKLAFLTIMLCFVTSFALQRHDPTSSVSCSASSPPSSPSSPTNSAQSSPSSPPSLPRVRGPRDLGRMLEEEETRALAQEREADEQRLQLETEMDAEGIRRPRDRKLSFTPASAFLSSSHVRERPDGKSCAEIKARKNIELMATGGVAVAEEEGELAIDRHMLRKAYEVRRARVESLSRFQSKRKRHGRQSGQDIFRVLNRVLPPSCQSSSLPSSFHLLSLGGKGPRRLLPSTDVTLRAAGLMGPTASLLFRWEKGEGQLLPKATAEWMDPALFPATGDGAGVHECGDG